MRWPTRRKWYTSLFPKELPTAQPDSVNDAWRSELTLLATTLLSLLQQYRWDLEEIKTTKFQEQVHEFKCWLPAAPSPEAIADARQEFCQDSVRHLMKEQKYLEEREQELKRMISVLTEALGHISVGNEDYHSKITQTTQTLSQISQLEDIRKIRSSLTSEIGQLKDAVKERRSKEQQQQAQLMGSIETLQKKLKSAVICSLRDSLTGLLNRQGFNEAIVEACQNASLTRDSFTVAIVDVDGFKRINDSGGHQVGDIILVKLADYFKKSSQVDDALARLGGDEFVFLLANSSLERARKRLERMCQEISKPTYNCPVEGKDFYTKISITGGISLYRAGDTQTSLLRRADEALYLAKKAGKNQVMTEADLVAKTA